MSVYHNGVNIEGACFALFGGHWYPLLDLFRSHNFDSGFCYSDDVGDA